MLVSLASGRYHPVASLNTATAAPGQFLIDAAGNRWGISGGLVTFNGATVASPTGVINLAIVNGGIWAETTPTSWFRMISSNGVATVSGGAQANPLPTITDVTLSNSSFTPAGSAAGTVVGTITVVTTNGSFSPAIGTLTLSGTDAAKFQIVSGVLQLASAQAAGSYSINIIATQNLFPGSPFTKPISVTGVSPESQAGTLVTTVGPTINASPTPGTPGFGNVMAITSGAQISINGAAGVGTAVDALYYIGNTVFQRGSALWWGPVTTSSTGIGPVADPRPQVALSNALVPAGSPGGTVVGAVSVAVGAGTYSWTYTLSGTNAGSFTVTGGNLVTVGNLANGSYGPFTISAANAAIVGSPFTLSVTVVVSVAESQAGSSVTTVGPTLNASPTPGTAGTGNVIAINSSAQIVVNGGTPFGAAVDGLYYIGSTAFQHGSGDWYGPVTSTDGGVLVADPHPTVNLSNLTVAPNVIAGSTVGTISVAVGAGTYSWTYSLSGANASSFQLSGSTLQTSAPLAAGAYAVTITATNAAIIGSPFSLSTSISVQVAAAGGVAFPAVGVYGQDRGMLAASNQPNGKWACKILYNQYQGPGWGNWSKLDGAEAGPYPPYMSLQISPGPRQTTFDANDWANNHIDAFNALAQNIAALGDAVVSANLGYEWNQGGAFNMGWDAAGNQALYITFMRNLCTAFQTYAPNVIRAWCMNHNTMASGGVPEDWYPGDDKIDAIGMEWYLAFAGAPSGTPLNNFPWLAGMCGQTRLGPNHPAKATGSMNINGTPTVIPVGKKKYIILAEGMASTAIDSNGVTNVWNWITQQQGRVLVLVYWNEYLVGTDNNQDLMTPSSTSGQQWIAGCSGKAYPHPWPIPRFT